jgi:outer membrane protein
MRCCCGSMMGHKRRFYHPGHGLKRGRSALKIISVMVMLVTFLAAGIPVSAGAEDLLTVYEQAAATSPVLARARALLQADVASGDLARSALLPKIEADAGVNRNKVDITGFAAEAVDTTYTGNNYGVTLTQPIISGQDWVALRASRSQIRAGEYAVSAAEQQLILQVSQAYFEVLAAQANERVAESRRDLLNKILDQATAFLEAGTGTIVDVSEARARLDAARSDLIRGQNAVQIAIQRLKRLTHQPVITLDDLGTFQPRGPIPDSVDPWLKAALENQPSLMQAREQLRISEDQVEIARRARWPRLNLDAGYNSFEGTFLPTIDEDELHAGLVFSLPIYRGGEIGAKIRQARAQALAGEYNLEDLKDQIRLDTESAFLNLKDSVAQIHADARAVESAKISMDATQRGYEIGTVSIIDYLDSVQNYANARRDYFVSLYNHVVNRVRLKTAAGVLTVKDIEALNSMLIRSPGKPGTEGRPEERAGK